MTELDEILNQARAAVRDVMASEEWRALFQLIDDEDEVAFADAVLRAVRDREFTTTCPVCWGRVNDIAPGAKCKNPDCVGGSVPSGVRLGFMEQVGVEITTRGNGRRDTWLSIDTDDHGQHEPEAHKRELISVEPVFRRLVVGDTP